MVVGLIAAVAGLAAGINGHRNSSADTERDRTLQGDAADLWKNDRQHIQNEYSLLSREYNNPAPPAITDPEAFDTWSHREIYDALYGTGDPDNPRGVQQADINAGADGWRKLTGQAKDAIKAFREGIQYDIEHLWSGRTANSAMTASQSYADEFHTLAVSFEQVAGGIDLIQGYLDQAKLSVPPPEELDAVDRFLGHVPGNGVLKLGQHRANEAEARAQEAMKIYQLGATEVDEQTPILPEPKNPVNSSNPGDNTQQPGSTPPGSTPGPVTPGSQDPSKTADPSSTDDPSKTEDQSSTEDPSATDDPSSTDDPSTDPASTDPASTVPASSQPSTLTDPSGKPSLGSPGSGSPGSGSPGSGSPGSTPSPGASIPGNAATSAPTGAAVANARTAGTTGRAGMPGMGAMGGGRGGGKDDESEHNIPDYLVQDRTTELLGEQPRVLPPGGVIGG
ncbi:hypothetical protein IU449_21665 [Nocardia higoensis]|uniref:PPE domain-containing protein n=1 Tax=Nocardia higoensis TaxID=228599 RepID=A0ABS0DK98_9NOCA|nr:hypothetical protein [Nocardia higoensis]MBF6357118.1 hypothetical protein [Nocardia higoensis]